GGSLRMAGEGEKGLAGGRVPNVNLARGPLASPLVDAAPARQAPAIATEGKLDDIALSGKAAASPVFRAVGGMLPTAPQAQAQNQSEPAQYREGGSAPPMSPPGRLDNHGIDSRWFGLHSPVVHDKKTPAPRTRSFLACKDITFVLVPARRTHHPHLLSPRLLRMW